MDEIRPILQHGIAYCSDDCPQYREPAEFACHCELDDGSEGLALGLCTEWHARALTRDHRLRRVQAAARKLADAKHNLAEAVGVFADGRIEDQARHHDLLRALKRWHDDVEEGTVCHWCRTDLHEDESEIPHTENCPWRWILDACREAGVE